MLRWLPSAERVSRKPKVLIIDELGYLPIDKHGADLLFQIIRQRYERASIIVTSNRAFKHWPEIFSHDSTLSSARGTTLDAVYQGLIDRTRRGDSPHSVIDKMKVVVIHVRPRGLALQVGHVIFSFLDFSDQWAGIR